MQHGNKSTVGDEGEQSRVEAGEETIIILCLLLPGTTLSTSGKVSRMVLWKIWTPNDWSSQGLVGRGSNASTTSIFTLSSAMMFLTVSSTCG